MNAGRLACVWMVAVLTAAGPASVQRATAAQEPDAAALPPTIPIFPLQDVVLFPNASRPLHIFEPRYRAMVADALEGDRIIGMVLLQPGHEAEYEGRPPIYTVGCAGVIAEVEELPDGRYNIVLEGLVKFRVVTEDQSRAYRVAAVEALPELLDDADRTTLHRRRVRLEELLASVAPDLELPATLPAERLVDGLSLILDLDPGARQELLELDGPLERAESLIERLQRQLARPL